MASDLPLRAADADADPATCERVSGAARAFVAGTRRLGSEDRTHLGACSDCRAAYEDAVATTAMLGRASRVQREARDIQIARKRNRRLAFQAGSTTRRGALRIVLMPAAVAVLLVGARDLISGPPRVEVRAEAGEVVAGGAEVAPLDGEAWLMRGEACRTGAGGRAVLAVAGVELALDADSHLSIEGARPPRFRLAAGAVELAGTCAVTTPFGIAELDDGTARLRIADGAVELACVEGGFTWTDRDGERTVAPGTELQVQTWAVGLSSVHAPRRADGRTNRQPSPPVR